jgi:hypothetical protein
MTRDCRLTFSSLRLRAAAEKLRFPESIRCVSASAPVNVIVVQQSGEVKTAKRNERCSPYDDDCLRARPF